MFVRRYFLNEIPKRKILRMWELTKFYFKEEIDIFYFTFRCKSEVEYGLMLSDWPEYSIELDADTFQILNQDVISTLTKTVYEMILDDNQIMPITLFEVHYYNELRLVIAELKFETRKLMHKFIPPNWFGNEIMQVKFDLELAFPEMAQCKSLDEVSVVIQKKSISEEAKEAQEIRNNKLGTFEYRLQKVRNRPKKSNIVTLL